MGIMHYAYVLWDFDGTLADTFACMVTAYNALAAQRGLRPLDDPDAARGLSPLAFLRSLGIPLVNLPSVVSAVLASVRQDMAGIRLFAGIGETLEALKRAGCRMSVLSSNAPENIQTCLQANGVAAYFEAIHGYRRVWGKGEGIRRFLKRRAAASDRAVYVGDEVRDIVAARKAGVTMAAVTWGYNTRQILADHHPDYLIETPAQLVTLLTLPPP
jgi:phosphoglycolate phosphatase